MKKKLAVTCDCEPCTALANKYGFEVRNWFCDTERPMDFAVLPARERFSDEAVSHIFNIFTIPDYYKHLEYPLPPEKYQQSFACKFADTKEKYQAAELVVRQYKGYYFCRLARYEKWYDGVFNRYEFLEWNPEREAALPNHLEWVLELSLKRADVDIKHMLARKTESASNKQSKIINGVRDRFSRPARRILDKFRDWN